MSTSADIISTLLARGMILGRGAGSKVTAGTGNSNTVLAAWTMEGCTNPQCKARKRSSHKTIDCYWPGGGKEGQFPANFGQRAKANITTSNSTTSSTSTPTTATTPGQTEHFVLLAQTLSTPGQSRVVIDNSSDDDVNTDFPHKAFISKGFQNYLPF